MNPTDPKECIWLIVDGCYHDYLCAKKIVSDGIKYFHRRCLGNYCPDFNTNTDNDNGNKSKN